MRTNLPCVSLLAFAVAVLFPTVTSAQSGIAGVVRDATGALLPGVTVEASSPAMIERVRTALTDGAGLYRLVDLRPGVYEVTFTLPGFATVRQEGIELPASFTATVNAEMRVGALEETVTVSGQTPTVDVQSVASLRVLSDELLNAIPTVRLPQSYVPYLPGVTGVALGAQHRETRTVSIHGSRPNESNVGIAGSQTRHIMGMGGVYDVYYMSTAIIEELSIELGTSSAERQTGGIFTNVIPKEGSNTFSGFLYASYSDENLQTSNLTDELKARNFAVPGVKKLFDVNPAFGGRIVRDKVWFYSAFRQAENSQYVAGLFYNKTPLAWTYTPDLSRPAFQKVRDKEGNTRLTWQATAKNKISAYFSLQPHYVHQRNITPTVTPVSPEATTYTAYLPNSFAQIIWKSPVTNRILLEGGVTRHQFDYDTRRQIDPEVGFDAWSALEQRTGMRFRAASVTGVDYGHHNAHTYGARASASYITGSHAFKVGLDNMWGSYNEYGMNTNGDIAVTLLDGVPRTLTLAAFPLDNYNDVNADLGVFAQDRWTMDRLTLDLGVRYDYFNSSVPEQHLAAGRFVPARDYAPVSDTPNWKDVTPRLGVSYDLFGDGKTALKAFVGRYVAGWGANIASANNPVNTSVRNVNRTWNDANRDYIPDCELSNPVANGECGGFSDVNFGKRNSRASRYDEAVLRGSGKRGYNWEASAVLQRELVSRLSVNAGYYRRWYGNLTLTDNLALSPTDYDPFCITAPVDSRLPGGGGQDICGLYDVRPAKFGVIDNLITFSKSFGTQREIYDGVDLTINARFGNGGQVSGGVNTGRTATDRCFVVDSPQELRFCDSTPPFVTQVKFIGLYPLPWWGLQFSGVIQSVPGPQITADYVATNAEIRPSLGRDLSSGVNGTVTVPLIKPGTIYAGRSNQIDLRVSKTFRLGRARIVPHLDLFNLLNENGVQVLNPRWGPVWQDPTQIQGARYVQFSGEISF
jgi:hypothetical protein